MSTLVARLIQENGDRVRELHRLHGEYVLRLKVHDLGELRHVRHHDRVLTQRQAGEWIETVRSCGGYVPQVRGAA